MKGKRSIFGEGNGESRWMTFLFLNMAILTCMINVITVITGQKVGEGEKITAWLHNEIILMFLAPLLVVAIIKIMAIIVKKRKGVRIKVSFPKAMWTHVLMKSIFLLMIYIVEKNNMATTEIYVGTANLCFIFWLGFVAFSAIKETTKYYEKTHCDFKKVKTPF